ncbi:SET domain-containing protein [Periconia macrospinosa]|uniref:SET domain-containing protein n=1 Tax=Periconia macrospinosa TaxID=97972 RepID=A0A2V1E9T4_9PLEO|nr:SET domain-containing protein [Periconia macrospinosa]
MLFLPLLISLSSLPTIYASPPTCKPTSFPLPQHTCSYPPEPYIVLPTAGKGLGVFARHDLPPGTIILRETPILTIHPPPFKKGTGYPMPAISSAVRTEFSKLPPSSQTDILHLHHHAFPGEFDKGDGWTDVLGYIFRTNAYNTGTDIGLFPRIARINHSCQPNAAYVWNERERKRVVYASRAIRAGEEISDSYIPLLIPREERKKRLERYGFQCSCEACLLRGKKGRESDERRVEISTIFKELEAYNTTISSSQTVNKEEEKKAIDAAKRSLRLLSLLEKEQLADYYARAYKAVAVTHARVRDWETASVWANKGFERRVMEDAGSAWTVEMAELTGRFIEEWKRSMGAGTV